MSSNKLEMVKCEKFTYKYVPNKHAEKISKFSRNKLLISLELKMSSQALSCFLSDPSHHI